MELSAVMVALLPFATSRASADVILPAFCRKHGAATAGSGANLRQGDARRGCHRTFQGQTTQTKTGRMASGSHAQTAQSGRPFTFTLPNNTITFQNVLVGEVWVCGGNPIWSFGLKGRIRRAKKHLAGVQSQYSPALFPHVRSDVPEGRHPGYLEECTRRRSPTSARRLLLRAGSAKGAERSHRPDLGKLGGLREAWTREDALTSNRREAYVDNYLPPRTL